MQRARDIRNSPCLSEASSENFVARPAHPAGGLASWRRERSELVPVGATFSVSFLVAQKGDTPDSPDENVPHSTSTKKSKRLPTTRRKNESPADFEAASQQKNAKFSPRDPNRRPESCTSLSRMHDYCPVTHEHPRCTRPERDSRLDVVPTPGAACPQALRPHFPGPADARRELR